MFNKIWLNVLQFQIMVTQGRVFKKKFVISLQTKPIEKCLTISEKNNQIEGFILLMAMIYTYNKI